MQTAKALDYAVTYVLAPELAQLPNGAATTQSFTQLDDFKSHAMRLCSLSGGLAGVTLVNKRLDRFASHYLHLFGQVGDLRTG